MRVVTFFAAAVLSASLPVASAASSLPKGEEARLQRYLERTFHTSGELRYRAAGADLDGDGNQEIVVRIMSHEFCGSGGCKTLVLQHHDNGYRTVMSATITWPPIRVLETRTHGWRDMGVTVRGGGISPPYEAVLRFDGERYPSNPSMAPAAGPGSKGQTLISATP